MDTASIVIPTAVVAFIAFAVIWMLSDDYRNRKPVATLRDLNELREKVNDLSDEVFQLREEVERLKQSPPATESTAVSKAP